MRRLMCIGFVLGSVGGLLFFLATHRYLFEKFNTYARGHIVINRTVFDDYYATHGSQALVDFALSEARLVSRANYHSTGHSVGEILFEHEEFNAVATCGDTFEWGCLHQVLGRSFSLFGSEAVPKLQKACLVYESPRKRGQCEHGLGHGIMYVHKYDRDQLGAMLRVCDAITTTRPIPRNDSCHAGLLMEFNEHFINMEYEGINGRPVDPEGAFHTCSTLSSAEHKDLCLFWTVPWVHGKLYNFRFTSDTFKSMGALCETLQTQQEKNTCFESLGRSVGVNTNLAPTWVAQLCVVSSTHTDHARICFEQAARMYQRNNKKIESEEICSLAAQVKGRECRPELLR